MTRREKVLQRTRVGLTLAVAVAGLLYASSLPFGPELTRWLSIVLSLWCVFEVKRMGLFHSAAAAVGAGVTVLLGAFLMGEHPIGFGDPQPGLLSPGSLSWGFFAPGFMAVAPLDLLVAAGIGAGVGLVLAAAGSFRGPSGAGSNPDGSGGARPGALPSALIVPLIGLPLLFLYPLRLTGGAGALAAFVGLAKIGDIAGYYFGNLMGKSHPFPRLSPGKTTAGCVASLISGTAVGALLASFGALGEPRYGVFSGLAFGAIVNVTAQAGDLLESALKRRAGVKDSGTTFGPSGGMLDLVDSFFLAAPLAAFAGPLLFQWAS